MSETSTIEPDASSHDTTPDSDSAASTRSDSVPIALVSAISLILAISTVALLARGDGIWQAASPTSWWWLVVIIGGFALADRFTFHLEFRRQALTFTMSEIPTVFALIYAGPVITVAARVIVGVGRIYRSRPPPLYKGAFNGALFAVETALAYTILSMWTGWTGTSESMLVVGSAIAVAISCTAASGMVLVAIACFEGGIFERIRTELPIAAATATTGSVVGATAAASAFVHPGLVVLSMLPIASVWLTLTRHGNVAQSHRDLEAVHEFAAAIGRSLDLDQMANTALEKARTSLRTEGSAIVLHSTATRESRTWTIGSDALDLDVFADRDAQPPTTDVDVLAARFQSGADVSGYLVVANRIGVTDVYGDSDASRLDALATQLASALTNALAHERMEYNASHDPLTGNWNRSAFDRLVADRLRARPRCSAALMIDLDKFKEVNDTLGHDVGDDVLTEFASRVERLLDDGDVFARFGGDEFAVFVERSEESDIRRLADDVLSASYTAVHLDGLDVVVTSSVGIAMVSEHDVDSGSLLRRADIAMHTAKQQRAGSEMYSEDIDRRTPERLSLLGDLRRALDEQLLDVHYQPKIALDSGSVVGAEALVRWEHPTRGSVRPDEFIPLAEESGLIRLLTDQVLSASLEAVTEWRAQGHDIGVAVNLSTLDLLDDQLVGRVSAHLERNGLTPECLTLEITESSLMVETPRVMSSIEQLDELGVALALDDFGTGFSSLSYLRRLPVTELKIDRSFVSNLLLDQQDEVIVKSTIDLGHNLGLTVVAEGIESDRVSSRLTELGCDLGQGYGISRPLRGDLFMKWLTSWRPDAATQTMAPVVSLAAARH